MKTMIRIVLGVFIALFIIACEDEKAATPEMSVEVNKHEFAINESMQIHFTGVADQFVVYTGDDMHDYELREESNTGFVVNKNLFTYAYDLPGTYKVVCVASTYTDKATDLKRDTCSFTVTVIDDVTEIEKLSCPQIIYDEVFAERLGNDEWAMILPRKVKYNNATPSINMTQRLKFYIASDSTKVFVDGKEFVSTERYDLTDVVDIQVQSDFGTVRPYKLHTIYYPEFETFTLAGVTGIVDRSEFDYGAFEMHVTLPAGTNVNGLIPEFTTYSSTEKVYIGDTEQMSGQSIVDFTHTVTYRLVSVSTTNADVQAESWVNVMISYE